MANINDYLYRLCKNELIGRIIWDNIQVIDYKKLILYNYIAIWMKFHIYKAKNIKERGSWWKNLLNLKM